MRTALILHKTPNVDARTNDETHFENLLMTYQDSPFPLMEDREKPVEEMIDICSDDKGGGAKDTMTLFFDPRLTTPIKR